MSDWISADTFMHTLHLAIAMNQTVPCWRLSTEPCIIALKQPEDLWIKEQEDVAEVKQVGYVCTLFATCLLLGFLVHYRHFLGEEVSALLQSLLQQVPTVPHRYQAVPTKENGFTDLATRQAKHIVDVAVANADQDTPCCSGNSTGRNIALDFV